MLGRTHRFHGLGSLNSVYRHGQTVRGAGLSLKFAPNPRRQTYRLAVVVSRKVHKSAVKRNRLRRRIYEIVRNYQPKITEPYDLVLSVFNEHLSELDSAKLKRIVHELLDKAGTTKSPKPPGHAIVKPKESDS